MAADEMTAAAQKWADQFSKTSVCPLCHGARLNREALSYRFNGKNIYELSSMDVAGLYEWLDGVETKVNKKSGAIAREILKELRSRL